MSHVSAIKTCITDIPALGRVAAKRGMELIEKQNFNWYGRWVRDYHQDDAAYKNGFDPSTYGKCDFAIRDPKNPGGYEIGVVKNPDGEGYSLMLDHYGSGSNMVRLAGGKLCEGLIQDYTVEAARSSDGVKDLVENHHCVEHQLVDPVTGDVLLVYEDEGMGEQEVKQYLFEGQA